ATHEPSRPEVIGGTLHGGPGTGLGDVAGADCCATHRSPVAPGELTDEAHAALDRTRVVVVAIDRGRATLAAHDGGVDAAEQDVTAVGGARVAVVAVRSRPGGARAGLAGFRPVARVGIGAGRAVRSRAVGRTGRR